MHASIHRIISSAAWPILMILSIFIFSTSALSEASMSSPQKKQEAQKPGNWETRFTFESGYRIDNIDWNIGGNYTSTWDGGPVETRFIDILSELTWKDLEIYQVVLSNRTIVMDHLYFRGSLGYGEIFDGRNRDSDYKGNNRTLEFSRSDNASDSGHVIDVSVGIGYLFQFKSGRVGIAPVAGYTLHSQNLRMTDGHQTLSVPPDQSFPVGPIQGLDSSYDTRWQGPFLGIDLLLNTKQPVWWFRSIALDITVEAHWADYYAEADWNLIPSFQHPKSFEHEADGTGIVIAADWILGLTQQWDLSFGLNYMKWSTKAGTDRLFYANGTTVESRLNEVNWDSTAFLMGITYRF